MQTIYFIPLLSSRWYTHTRKQIQPKCLCSHLIIQQSRMHKQAAGYCSSWLPQCNHKAGEKWGKWEGHHPQPYHSGLQQQREGPAWALSDSPLNQEGKCRGFKEEQVKQWDKTEHTTPSSCGHRRQAPAKPGCKGRALGCSEGCKVRALRRCIATASRRWTPEDNQYTNFLGCSHSFSCNTREMMFTSWLGDKKS